MNHMLHCGSRYNDCVQDAFAYLPNEVQYNYREGLAFIATGESDGCRVAPALCQNREVIVLSERILPKKRMGPATPEVRYFIFSVLHEVAHVYLKHGNIMFDGIKPEENDAQEAKADKLAMDWFNDHIEEMANPDLSPLGMGEIDIMRVKHKAEMKSRYEL